MSRHKHTAAARPLRRKQTDAEAKLWLHLKSLRHLGFRFRRQHPIGTYFVDFVCLERKLVLEVDGSRHSEPLAKEPDKQRTAWLESEGYRVIRIGNNDVLSNMDGVLELLSEALEGDHHPTNPADS